MVLAAAAAPDIFVIVVVSSSWCLKVHVVHRIIQSVSLLSQDSASTRPSYSSVFVQLLMIIMVVIIIKDYMLQCYGYEAVT